MQSYVNDEKNVETFNQVSAKVIIAVKLEKQKGK